MEETDNNSEFWGLSLSLQPPISHNDQNKFGICKRKSLFFTDEQSSKMQNFNNKELMMMPKINKEVKIEGSSTINLEQVEIISKEGSPNSTLSSSVNSLNTMKTVVVGLAVAGGFSGEREVINYIDGGGDGYGGGGGDGERKKLRLSNEQIMVLEQAFEEHFTLNNKQKMALAKQVNLRPRQVEVWFQNRRVRTKLKQTKTDYEKLIAFCESLTEENKKLQKEVQELKAMKVSPTTLTMCPSCKIFSSSSATTAPPPVAGETGWFPVGAISRSRLT